MRPAITVASPSNAARWSSSDACSRWTAKDQVLLLLRALGQLGLDGVRLGAQTLPLIQPSAQVGRAELHLATAGAQPIDVGDILRQHALQRGRPIERV